MPPNLVTLSHPIATAYEKEKEDRQTFQNSFKFATKNDESFREKKTIKKIWSHQSFLLYLMVHPQPLFVFIFVLSK